MPASAQKKPCVIELAGLPGTGKTTICNLLAARLGTERLSFIHRYNKCRYRTLLSLPFVPLTVQKFHRIFRRLIRVNERRARASTKAGFEAVPSERPNPDMSVRKVLSILSVLNTFLVEYWLARVEARIRKRAMILDGGFIQRGISMWMRAPREMRADLWDAYLSHTPKSIVCIVLQCQPAEALRRAKSRPEGVPAFFKRRMLSAPDENWLLETYSQMLELLMSEALSGHVRCVYMNAEMDADKIVDFISAEVESVISSKEILVQ